MTLLSGNDRIPSAFGDPWYPPSFTDPDANTASLHQHIQDLFLNASRDEANLYLPRLQIRNLPGARVIPVRPNILPDYPSGLTNFQRAGGLVIEGASPRSTVFQIQYDGTPTADYYAIDPAAYDTPASTEGLYARLVLCNLGFCVTGGGPNITSAFDTTDDVTNTDVGATALWRYAKFIKLQDWSKDHAFYNCWFQDFRTIAYTDPASTVTADRTYWERCYASGCGTWLEMQDVQSQLHNFVDCESSFTRRSLFVLGAGGGQSIHWTEGFIHTDPEITDASATEATYHIFDYEPGHQNNVQSGKCSMRDIKMELKGRLHGLLKNVPTSSEGPAVNEDTAPETRVNETIFDNVVVSATDHGLGDGLGVGRVIVQVGPSRRGVFRDCSWIPRNPAYVRDTDWDWCKFRLVMNDELIASGGSLARNVMLRPPELIFDRCSGNENFFATNIEFARDDGTPSMGTGRVLITDYTSWRLRAKGRRPYTRDQYIEDVRYGCMGPGKSALDVGEIIAPVVNGTTQAPGSTPTLLDRLIPPPCVVTGAEIRLAAKSGVQVSTATCSYGLTSEDGSTVDINTGSAQDPDLAYYLDTIHTTSFEPIVLTGEIKDRAITFNAQQVTGTVNTITREHDAFIRYRAYKPFWDGSTALGDVSPWREGRAYSQQLLDHLRYWFPCDEGADLIVEDNSDGTGYSERQNGYGFDSANRVLDGAGSTLPTAASDGTLVRYVWTYPGSGTSRHRMTGVTPGEMELDSTFSIAWWMYPEDQDASAAVLLEFDTGDDYLQIGCQTNSTNELAYVQVGYDATFTKQTATIPNGLAAWTACLLTFDGTTFKLYLGSTTAAKTWTTGNTVSGQVTSVGVGGTAGGGSLFQGKVGGWAFLPKLVMSATDYTEMYTNNTLFPRQ